MGYITFFCLLNALHLIQASTSTVFQQNQLEDECGVFSGTVHKDHSTPEENESITVENNNSTAHVHDDDAKTSLKWPWQGVIKVKEEFKCNGMLVKKNWVLTSASCVDDEKADFEFQINNETYKTSTAYKFNTYDAENPKTLVGDVALLKLSLPIPIEAKLDISPICLPRSKQQMKHSTECSVTYMSLEKNNKVRTYSASAKIVSQSKCDNNAMKVDSPKKKLLCIATTDEMKTSCTKSPIMFFSCQASGYWSLHGMSKFCHLAKTTEPGYSYAYYNAIIGYSDWIKSKTDIDDVMDEFYENRKKD